MLISCGERVSLLLQIDKKWFQKITNPRQSRQSDSCEQVPPRPARWMTPQMAPVLLQICVRTPGRFTDRRGGSSFEQRSARASGQKWNWRGRALTNNGLEESQALPRWRGCGEKPLCIVTKATTVDWWGGKEKERRTWDEEEWGERKVLGGEKGWRVVQGAVNSSPGFIIHSISALFTLDEPQLRGRIYSFL